MRELVESIAKALVDNPDQVSVTEIKGEQTTVLEVRVANQISARSSGNKGELRPPSVPSWVRSE